MKHIHKWAFFFFALLLFFPQEAVAEWDFSIGPEVYYMRRWREGGVVQRGRIDGLRITAERWKACSLYLGATSLISEGTLSGHNGLQLPIRSEITDYLIEGRIGFNFSNPMEGSPYLTVYGGYGYLKEKNAFAPPSPITFTFIDTIQYGAFGFLSGINFNPLLSMGINFEVRFMFDGESKVTDDPLFDDISLAMNDEVQIRVEVPLQALLWGPEGRWVASFAPFYEFRHFGGREGFPFDFLDTKFNLFGVQSTLIYRF